MRFHLMTLIAVGFSLSAFAAGDGGYPGVRYPVECTGSVPGTVFYNTPDGFENTPLLDPTRRAAIGRQMYVCLEHQNADGKKIKDWALPSKEQLTYFLNQNSSDPAFRSAIIKIDGVQVDYTGVKTPAEIANRESKAYQQALGDIAHYQHPALMDNSKPELAGPFDTVARKWTTLVVSDSSGCYLNPANCPPVPGSVQPPPPPPATLSSAPAAEVPMSQTARPPMAPATSVPKPSLAAAKPVTASGGAYAKELKEAGAQNAEFLRSISNEKPPVNCCPTDADDRCGKLEDRIGFSAYVIITEPSGAEQWIVPIGGEETTYHDGSATELHFLNASKKRNMASTDAKRTIATVGGKQIWVDPKDPKDQGGFAIRSIRKISLAELYAEHATGDKRAPSCMLQDHKTEWGPKVALEAAATAAPGGTRRRPPGGGPPRGGGAPISH